MLEPNEVLDVLNLTVKPNGEPGKKEFKKMEVNAIAIIVQSLSYSILESIKDIQRAYKGRYEYNWENFYKNWLNYTGKTSESVEKSQLQRKCNMFFSKNF